MKYEKRIIDSNIRKSSAWKTEMNETTSDVLQKYGYEEVSDFLDKKLYMFIDLEGFAIDDVVHALRFILETVFPRVKAQKPECDEDDFYESDPAGNSTAFFPDMQWDEITVEDLICNPFVDFYTIEEAIYEIAEFFYYSDYYDMHKWHYADKRDMENALRKHNKRKQ